MVVRPSGISTRSSRTAIHLLRYTDLVESVFHGVSERLCIMHTPEKIVAYAGVRCWWSASVWPVSAADLQPYQYRTRKAARQSAALSPPLVAWFAAPQQRCSRACRQITPDARRVSQSDNSRHPQLAQSPPRSEAWQ